MTDSVDQIPENSQRHPGHESTDVSPLAIGLFATGLVLMIAVVLPLLGWTFWTWEASARRSDLPSGPLFAEPTWTGPKLQAQPAVELARMRREEDHRLSSYGWIDQPQGVVRIPVDQAMMLLAKRGFPEPRGNAPTEPQETKP
jgi:hypothetical protein